MENNVQRLLEAEKKVNQKVNAAMEEKRNLLNSIANEAAIQVEAYRVQAEAEF